jgi:hypothetical protein
MSSCQCCLKPHPIHLIERHNSSIQIIKLIHKNCSIFENILLDEYEYLERVSSNLNKYLMQYGTISNQIFSFLSQLIIQLNKRLENLRKYLYEFDCLIIKCSIWLKNNSIKQIHSQLKHYKKQLNSFEQHSHIIQYKNNLTKKFWKNFTIFQTNYQQQCLQMDSIEYEYMKLFLDSIQLFSLIISSENNEKFISTINIKQNINEWKEKNKFHITWIPNEHNQKENNEKFLEKISSDIEIKAIDNCSNDNQDKYVHESNLSWSFTLAKPKEDLKVEKTKSIEFIFKNKVS